MKRKVWPVPVADACRIILAREQLGDLSAALGLLGVKLGAIRPPADLLEGELEEEAVVELMQEVPLDEQQETADESEETDEDLETEEEAASIELHEANVVQALLKSDWGTEDGPIRGNAYHGSDRSMVSYLLTPDQDKPNEAIEQPTHQFTPVPIGIQGLQHITSIPDAEAWRVARRVSDMAPKVRLLGKIDVRKCIRIIANAEPITYLPRVEGRATYDDIGLLIDLKLVMGPLAGDVSQLVHALRSIGVANHEPIPHLLHRDDGWFVGLGPIWTFEYLANARLPKWCVIILGGTSATPENREVCDSLIAIVGKRSKASLVWIGDRVARHLLRSAVSWTGYRP